LRNLARDGKESIRLVHKYSAGAKVCKTLRSFEASFEICADGCGLLANLAAPEANRDLVIDECLSIVLNSMHRHSGESRVAQNGLAFLANLANDVSHLNELWSQTPQTIIEVSSIHAKDVGVAENAQTVIAAMSVDSKNVGKFLAHQSTSLVGLVCNLMQLHSRNPVIAEQGLHFICEVADTTENKLLLTQCNVFTSIEAAMTSCSQGSVAEWGCKAIRTMSLNHQPTKTAIYRAGAGLWIVKVMRAHGTYGPVVRAALLTLWSLANSPTNKEPMVVKDEVHTTIINTMRLNPDSLTVALTGTGTLASLANDVKTKKIMMQDGVVTAIIHAMNSHPMNAYVCEYGCAGIWSLSIDHDVQAALTSDSLVSKVVIETLVRHAQVRAVLMKSLGALESLAFGQQAAFILMKEGTVSVMVAMMKQHMYTDLELTLRCFIILGNIAHYSDDFGIFHLNNVADLAIEVQRYYPVDERCTRATERLLTFLEGGKMVVI